MSVWPDAARALTDAAARRDKQAAWHAMAELLPWLGDLRHPVEPGAAFQLVWSGAANNRWFDIAELLAGAVASRAGATVGSKRLHAQMLMERGFDDEALSRLEPLKAEPSLSDRDRDQVFGHLGRIHKDRFVAAVVARHPSAEQHLAHAIDAYLAGYQAGPKPSWLGINAVALLARPEAQRIRPEAEAEARRLAGEVLADIPKHDPQFADGYSSATAAEASLALGDHAAVLDWLRRYVTNPGTSGFALGATLRQFIQIWQLDRCPSPGPEIIDLLRAAAMDRLESTVQMSGNDVRRARESVKDPRKEAVFGADRFDSIENYRRGLERSASVARIGRSAETGVGTGFLLPGTCLDDRLGDRFVLVTNAHVLSRRDRDLQEGAVHPDEAVVTFAALDGVAPTQEFGVSKILFSSPPDVLDVTIAELSEPVAPQQAIPLSPVLPTRGTEAQLRAIGHPSGRGLSFSSGRFLDHQLPKLHYRTATEGGSSGSPVFNAEWRLIGLHHVGGEAMPKLNGEPGTYEANEGMSFEEIRRALVLDRVGST